MVPLLPSKVKMQIHLPSPPTFIPLYSNTGSPTPTSLHSKVSELTPLLTSPTSSLLYSSTQAPLLSTPRSVQTLPLHSSSVQKILLLLLEEDVFERPAEVLVEDCVDDRVEGTIAVPDPEEELEESLRDLTCLPADAIEAVAEEEGEPAHHKDPHDHSQHKREAFLPGLGDLLTADAAALPAAVRGEEIPGAIAGALGGVGI